MYRCLTRNKHGLSKCLLQALQCKMFFSRILRWMRILDIDAMSHSVKQRATSDEPHTPIKRLYDICRRGTCWLNDKRLSCIYASVLIYEPAVPYYMMTVT